VSHSTMFRVPSAGLYRGVSPCADCTAVCLPVQSVPLCVFLCSLYRCVSPCADCTAVCLPVLNLACSVAQNTSHLTVYLAARKRKMYRLHSAQCTACTQHSVPPALSTMYRLHSAHCTACTQHSVPPALGTMYRLHSAQCTACTRHTVPPALGTLYRLHSAQSTV
jgi:hypothetical protein